MATTIESVDNLSKPLQHDKVNPTERSSSEHQRRQFKKALKEEMEQDKGKGKDTQKADVIMIEQDDKDRKRQGPRDQDKGQTDQSGGQTQGKEEEDVSDDEHIDLKA